MLRVRARGRPGLRGRPLQRAYHLLIPLLAGVAVAAASTAAAQPTNAADTISTVGVRASLDGLILRARLREAGWLVAIGENANVPGPLVLGMGSGRLLHDPVPGLVPPLGSAPLLSPAVARVAITAAPQIHYSPELATVFVLGGPGYFPTPPDYYFAHGVYPVYDPPAFDDPSISVLAAP